MPTLISFSNLNWTDWKNDAVSRRAASLFRTLRSIYHHLFFEKKTANSTDSNKVDPEKSKKKKNYGILDYYKFLSAKS